MNPGFLPRVNFQIMMQGRRMQVEHRGSTKLRIQRSIFGVVELAEKEEATQRKNVRNQPRCPLAFVTKW